MHDEPQLAGWAWRSRRRFWLPAANVSPIRATSRTQPGRSQRFKQYEVIVPTVRDRVAMAAAKIVLEPVFEADFLASSYGFRPKRSAEQANETIRAEANRGGNWVLDADVRDCFGFIDRDALLAQIARRVSNRRMLKLLRAR